MTIEEMLKTDLEPNEIVYLYCSVKNLPIPPLDVNLKGMQYLGYFDGNYELTQKARDLFEEKGVDDEFVHQYREIFPRIRLSSGVYARSDAKDLKALLKKFVKVYGFTKEEILTATKLYVEFYSRQRYEYMKNSYYFIAKRGEPSMLASYCEAVRDGATTMEEVTTYLGGKMV